MKLARPQPEHSLLVLWFGITMCERKIRTLAVKLQNYFDYLMYIVIAREQERHMSRKITCTPQLNLVYRNYFVSKRPVSEHI